MLGYGTGVSEGGADDYAKNIGLGIVGSYGGSRAAKSLFGKGSTKPLSKNLIEQSVGVNINNLYNSQFDKDRYKNK